MQSHTLISVIRSDSEPSCINQCPDIIDIVSHSRTNASNANGSTQRKKTAIKISQTKSSFLTLFYFFANAFDLHVSRVCGGLKKTLK